MEFLFRPRSTGKRQVKPSQDIAFLEEQIAGDESSDDSFKLGNNDEDMDDSHASDSGDSSSGSSDDEEDATSSDDVEVVVDKKELEALGAPDNLSTEELILLAQRAKSASNGAVSKKILVCGCCLGQTSNDSNEIVECDGCGVSVHEGCYGVSETMSEPGSEVSAASTEPWFCEPCRCGFQKLPPCQLCPSKGGLLKATDAGQWVHLVCALYVPGVAFTDPESLTNVTLFELNYASWGRRTCMLCTDPRLAKTGICVQCDAGLCKSYFHATCAQAHGLLSEPSYGDADPYLAHCRAHTDRTIIKSRKQLYLTFVLQNQRRNAEIKQARKEDAENKQESVETEQQRILRKLAKQQESYKRDRVKKQTPWVPTQKLPRLLTTSASAIRKIEKMGEIQGISVKRQRLEEQQVLAAAEGRRRWHVPPSFSVSFVSYFGDRQERIEELKARLADHTELHTTLRGQEMTLQPKFDQNTKALEKSQQENKCVREQISKAREVLSKLGKKLPDLAELQPVIKPLDIITPNIRAKTTLWSSCKGSVKKIEPTYTTTLMSPLKMKPCGICKDTKDQHLLVRCDTCLLYYHLGCLSPPLTRMPKKSKQYGWQCSECDKASEDEAAVKVEDKDGGPRKRRQAAAKAIAASSRDDRELDLAWQEIEGRRVKGKRGRKKKVVVPTTNGLHEEKSPLASNDALQNQEKSSNGPIKEEDEPKITEEDSEEMKRNLLIANAQQNKTNEEKLRRKELKRERKKRKKEKRKRREQQLLNQNHSDDPDDCDIVEKEDGQIIVSIKPKTIKLKIKAPQPDQGSNHVPPVATSSANMVCMNGVEKATPLDLPDEAGSVESVPMKKGGRQRSSASNRDIRTFCDKCQETGENSNLVRCDECSRCFHFWCLIPPVKKSPKVPGYGWHCTDCDPEFDTDWHLDK